MRDYGFVENFPQRWHYMEEDFQFDIDQIEDGKLIVTWDEEDRPAKADAKLMEQTRVWFRWEIRLSRARFIDQLPPVAVIAGVDLEDGVRENPTGRI